MQDTIIPRLHTLLSYITARNHGLGISHWRQYNHANRIHLPIYIYFVLLSTFELSQYLILLELHHCHSILTILSYISVQN